MAYIRTNIEGSYNILQASKEHGISNVIMTSTSETYGSAQYVPIDEKHPLVAQSPYAASKIAADQLSISYFRSYDMPIKLVRPFNTYGPRQSTRAIVPTVITQILNGEKSINVGNIYPTRDFTYVDDTVNGFIEISKIDSLNGEVTNIGMKSEIAIIDLIHLISNLMKKEIRIIPDSDRTRKESSEVDRLYCNNDKLIKTTNWRPKYDLNSGLESTIEWFRSNLKLYKSTEYNV